MLWPSSLARGPVSKLFFQASNRTLELAHLSGGRQIQPTRHAFQALVDLFLNPTAEAKPLQQRLLGSRISQQLGDPRILEHPKQPIAEIAHH